MSDVSINIVSQFLGQKAFDKAGNSANKLAGTVKKALIGVGFEEFARRSINAFAANEKEMATLANTLKNLGLEMQNASVASYLDKLALGTGALKSDLVPAFQTLATTTKDVADATTLLNLAMDVSAGSTNSLDSVVNALTKGYKGNLTSLGKLNVGIDKTMLATGDLQTVIDYLSKTFSGQADTAANTFANKVLRIKTAVEDAQEAFGKGLVDSLTILTGSKSIDELQKKIINFGTQAGNAFRTLAGFIKSNETPLKTLAALMTGLFIGSKITAGIYAVAGAFKALSATMLILRNTAIGAYIAEMAVLNPLAGLAAAAGIAATIYGVIKSLDMLSGSFDAVAKSATTMDTTAASHLATLNKEFGVTTKLVKYKKILTAEEIKAANAAKLKAAIARAELALGKGTDVFDMEKIQLQAAEINQAQQLGKVTSQAQLLAITNDLARLQVKKDILALEDAIASGDIKAIEAATNKLNADMKVLGALNGQELKLKDIKTILDTIVPKDLINLENLNEAIRLLGDISKSGAVSTTGVPYSPIGKAAIEALTPAQAEAILAKEPSSVATTLTPGEISGNRYAAQAAAQMAAVIDKIDLEGIAQDSFVEGIKGGVSIADALSGARYAAQGAAAMGGGTATKIDLTVNTGVGDPNAIAEAINQYLVEATDRGTLERMAIR